MNKVIHSYSNEEAVEDGFFADVTPQSVINKGEWRWIVTSSVQAAFSMAAIADMYNAAAKHYMKKNDAMCVHEMNGQTVWSFLEEGPGYNVFKLIFPFEY